MKCLQDFFRIRRQVYTEQLGLVDAKELADQYDTLASFTRCNQQVLKSNGILTKSDWEANRSGCGAEGLVDPVEFI